MRFFKYLVFIILVYFSTSTFAAIKYYASGGNFGTSPEFLTKAAACDWFTSIYGEAVIFKATSGEGSCVVKSNGAAIANITKLVKEIVCPSATKVGLKVPLNAQKYQCVNQCQYALAGCVDIPEERGQTCTAISTGIECGLTPPTKPKDPADTSTTPDSTNTPAAPGQNPSNTNTNSATSTGSSTSTSTSTTTNNTTTNTSTTNTTTTTNINTTTKIDLSSLESAIESIGKLLGGKLDAIKEALGGDSGSENGTPDGTDLTETNKKLDDIKNNGDKLNNWLQGKNEDGTGGGVGDNPFGTDVTPERTLDEQSFKTNIFQSNAQCPADKTLSMTLFTGRTFSRTLSFSMWCDKLAIFGSLILIAAYLYGASIIVRNS